MKSLPAWSLPLLAAIPAIWIFYPLIGADFVSWDDHVYILENDLIKDFSWDGVKRIFSTPEVHGGYSPIILLTWLIDYQLGGLNASVYHKVNVGWHLVSIGLVFYVSRQLIGSVSLSFVSALVFAIHPMHVEAVAWVTGRKDLVYSLFFFLSLVAYIKYVRSAKKRWLTLTTLVFALAVLAKAVAVVIPIIFLLMDWLLYKRPWFWKAILEKMPMFFFALFIGLLAIYGQQETGAVQKFDDFSLLVTPFIACYGLMFYLIRFFVPHGMSAYHPYPFVNNAEAPWDVFASAIPILLLLIIALIYLKKNRMVTFGILFFIVCNLPTLQFVPIGSCIVAERYTYVSYLGLILSVFGILRPLVASNAHRIAAWMGIGVIAIAFTVVARSQALTWMNSKALWKNAEILYADDFVVNDNLGLIYSHEENLDSALFFFNRELEVNPYADNGYNNRGHVYMRMGRYDLALLDLQRAVSLNPNYPLARMNLGVTLINLNRAQEAVGMLETSIAQDPTSALAHFNLGLAYRFTDRMDLAIGSYTRAIEIDPYQWRYFYRRGRAYGLIFQLDRSLNDIESGLALNPANPDLLTLRSEIHHSYGDHALALEDAQAVIAQGGFIAPSYLEKLKTLNTTVARTR